MAVTVTHATVTAVPDDPAYDIGSDEWNAAHSVSGLGTAAESAATDFVAVVGDQMTGALAIDLGTITTSTPAWNVTQTWNDGSVAFTGAKLNVTSTASASSSMLVDFQIGGASQFAVYKDGTIGQGGASRGSMQIYSLGSVYFLNSSGSANALWAGVTGSSQFRLDSKGTFCWTQTQDDPGDTRDTGLSRNAAGVVEVNNATPGTLRDLKARNVITPGVTVASLAGAAQGARSFVTDATQTLTAGIGAVVAGGGANAVPVHYDGTNWRIG